MLEAQERLKVVREQGASQQQAGAAKSEVEAATRWLEHIRRERAVTAGQTPLLERMVRLGMSLEGINASGVSLDSADLRGANLANANLTKTNLAGAKGITQEELDGACRDPGPPGVAGWSGLELRPVQVG